MPPRIPVTLETAAKRCFASAVEWPGWTRSGRTATDALAALLAAAARYEPVARHAGLPFDVPPETSRFEVVERLPGGGGTDFGVPSTVAAADERPISARDAERLTALLRAAWRAFDAAATASVGRELRKGPRGGGRELAKIVTHVLEAEEAYLSQLGSRVPRESQEEDPQRRMDLVRAAALETFARLARGEAPAEPNRVRRPWAPRYFVRRSAWHALDHAWEIEDRVNP